MDTALRFCVAVLLTLSAVCFSPPAAVALQDGEILGPDTWEEAQGLLPEEILDHYKKGEYVNQIADIRLPGYRSTALPQDFQEASHGNRGLYGLSNGGSVVELQSGKQPPFIVGLPFPEIDPNDAQAGTKIVWNFLYSTWYNGNYHFLTNEGLLNSRAIPSASAFVSPTGTNSPVTLSRTESTAPVALVTTTGRAEALASSTTFGKPSR